MGIGICEYDERNPKNIINFREEFMNLFSNRYNVIHGLAYILLTIVYNVLNGETFKHLGTPYRIIVDCVFSVLSMLDYFILDNEEFLFYYIILQIIGHVSLIIGIIIYNEIIIINMCGLNVNTVKKIKDRASTKIDYRKMLIPLFEKSNDKVDIL